MWIILLGGWEISMILRYELQLWVIHFLKLIPGAIGCRLRSMFIPYRIGKNSKIWEFFHVDSPSKLIVGDNVSINRGATINAAGGVVIGNDVLIGPSVTIYSQNHEFSDKGKLYREQGYSLDKVSIGNNVWLAANVTVLPGVSIVDNVVVAAGSVVNKSLLVAGLYGGIPAKLIRHWEEE